MANYYLGYTVEQLENAIQKVQNDYKDVSSVTAEAKDVAIGKKIVKSDGTVVDGTLDTDAYYQSGYEQGLQEATPTLQEKTATPSETAQIIVADTGYDGLLKVLIEAIPQSYRDAIYQEGYDAGYEEASKNAYPEGAFIPVTNFTAGKTYALVAKISGTYRYINTTAFNNYTMNATEVAVTEGKGYVTFGSEPALFTATASGDGFTLSNGSNFLHGTSSGGTALRVGTTSAVWTVDTSETGGFSSDKYLPKEDSSAVWLKNTTGGYDWSIKYESGNASFGYDRDGRDGTYSTGFVSFILYEKYGEQSSSGGSSGGDSGGGSTPTQTEVSVSITGTGDTDDSYTTIEGTKYYRRGSATTYTGSTISFTVKGYSTTYPGTVTINGTKVVNRTALTGTQTYNWTVPSGTNTVTIALQYADVVTGNGYGTITVTTT